MLRVTAHLQGVAGASSHRPSRATMAEKREAEHVGGHARGMPTTLQGAELVKSQRKRVLRCGGAKPICNVVPDRSSGIHCFYSLYMFIESHTLWTSHHVMWYLLHSTAVSHNIHIHRYSQLSQQCWFGLLVTTFTRSTDYLGFAIL